MSVERNATYIAICGPDEEQSGFVALTMWVESVKKEKHLIHSNSLIKHLMLKLTHIQWIVMQQQSHTFVFCTLLKHEAVALSHERNWFDSIKRNM